MGHYIYKSIPDVKFEVDSYDVTKFFSKEGNESSDSTIYPRKTDLTLKKRVFMSRIVLLDPKLTPMSILTIFKQRKIFSFSTFLGCLNDERAAATPLIDQFC